MIHYKIYYTCNNLPKIWDRFVKHDIFLQSSYLQALEEATPNNIKLYYIGVFKDDILIGVALIQRVQLYLKDTFRQTKTFGVTAFFKNILSTWLKGNALILGNLTHTGQHGLYFLSEQISPKIFFDTVFLALNEIKQIIKKEQNKTIRLIVLKDYFIDDVVHKNQQTFDKFKLHKVFVQPNMILSIKPQWLQLDNYIISLNKKYRDRYKRARKKFKGIDVRELSLESIKTNTKALYKLYMNVSSHAKINTFFLPENHFYTLKRNLNEHFKVYGYYLDNKLVGFYSLIINNNALETYFLGYNPKYQSVKQLYLNMLYDMLTFAIEHKLQSVVYARTAMEIKSSVGAEPKAMLVYLKHTNWALNTILKPVFKLMNPSQNWKQRRPFKD